MRNIRLYFILSLILLLNVVIISCEKVDKKSISKLEAALKGKIHTDLAGQLKNYVLENDTALVNKDSINVIYAVWFHTSKEDTLVNIFGCQELPGFLDGTTFVGGIFFETKKIVLFDQGSVGITFYDKTTLNPEQNLFKAIHDPDAMMEMEAEYFPQWIFKIESGRLILQDKTERSRFIDI